MTARIATVDDAEMAAALLDAFNREFDTPSPGVEVLTDRLREHLAASAMFAVLDGDPPVAVALVSVRPNVWYGGPAALLDELYVAPEHRNRGIGTGVLAEVEAEVRRRSCEILEINVDGQDTDARRFYARHGYTDTEPGQTEPSLYYFKEFQEREILDQVLSGWRDELPVPDEVQRRVEADLDDAGTGATDFVDVHVALCAKNRRHAVVTSDPDDISRIDPRLPLIRL